MSKIAIREFAYRKANGKEEIYSVLVLGEDENVIQGIKLNGLSEEKVAPLKEAFKTISNFIDENMKGNYRQFNRSSIVEGEENGTE